MPPEVEAGRVGRPHGLDGSFYVTRPLVDLLAPGTRLRVAGRATEVERRAGTGDRPIVRLTAFGSRTEIEAVRGEPLWAAREQAPPLEPDEYWADDLVGLRVTDGAREVGRVERVVALPSCDVLHVGGLLIPFVGDAVRSIDLDGGRIDIDLEFLGES